MKTFLTIAMSLVFATAAVHAQTTYIDQNYDSLTPPASPGLPAVAVRTAYVISTATNIVTGGSSGVAVWVNKNTTAQSGFLEYNAGPAALSNMYISFDLANNAPSATITQQMTFGVGAWNTTLGGSALNASANRFFAMDFYQGQRNNMSLRGAANFALTTGVAYATANYQNIQIWANGNGTTSIDYIRPDTLTLASLGPNSVVFWLNNALIFDEPASGYTWTNTANNVTMGRLGFTVTSGNLANNLIDNLYVADWSVIPEPSTCALVGFAGLMLVLARRRQAK